MAEPGQEVVVEMEAVSLVGPSMAIARRHHSLEALAPAGGDGVETKARRGRHPTRLERRDKLPAGASCSSEVGTGGAEVQPPGAAGANRVAAVGLAVDPALDPGTPRLPASAI